jgi:hypothetical protein
MWHPPGPMRVSVTFTRLGKLRTRRPFQRNSLSNIAAGG